MSDDPKSDTYSEPETEARREATLKVMAATPQKPHKMENLAWASKSRKEGGND